LSLGRQLVEHRLSLGSVSFDLPFLDQLHEEWTRYIEHVRGLLGGEFSMNGHDGDRVPVRHLAKDLASQLRH
jgi:hypothetical protein